MLEIFHRAPLKPDNDLRNFLVMVGGQAAIAIDSAKMFSELQKSNIELSLAYDATIEGLSRALDLRDKETKEHTFRVTDITVRLALRLGVGQSDLIHIRRGAILHDIGKVAIPDQILFKPGPLVEEEWVIMRKHPQFAYDMLSPIEYLRPALEIPYSHHEKWDGTGYPRQLRGEEIPLAARIFAVVDVFDALTSDRPYRKAWSREKALAHLKEQSGKHFFPEAVKAFSEMLEEQRSV